jgi:hypothetical protein
MPVSISTIRWKQGGNWGSQWLAMSFETISAS